MPAVVYVHTSAEGPVGHYTVEINDFGGGPFAANSNYYGYYPDSTSSNPIDYFKGPGEVRNDKDRTLLEKNNLDHNVSSPIPLTEPELQHIKDYIENVRNNPGNYDFNGDSLPYEGRNCVDFVYEALRAAGKFLADLFSDEELNDAGLAGWYADEVYGDGSLLNNPAFFGFGLPGPVAPLPGSQCPVSDPIGGAGGIFNSHRFSPLVFDLDGQYGLQLDPLEGSSVFYDLDNDGFAEQAGWTRTEGFLVRDANGNGLIDNQSEMFGLTAGGSAWDKLAAYDTNHDGSVAGTERGPLRMWIDADGDGRTDSGELKTLQQAGVASIDLTRYSDHSTVSGHEIDGMGYWTKTGGGTDSYYDVFFKVSQINAWYVGSDLANPPPVDVETLFLPLSRGYGSLKSLHLAMTEDAGLKAKVEALVSATDYTALSAQVVALLYDWAGVDGVAATSGGSYVDGRVLNFMERMTDTQYIGTDTRLREYDWPVYPQSGGLVLTAWAEAFSELKARLLAQSTFADIVGGTVYDFAQDALHFDDGLTAILARAKAAAPSNATQATWFWRELGGVLVQYAGEFGLSEAQVQAQLTTAAGGPVTLFSSYLTGLSTSDKFVGGDRNDYLLALGGDDYVESYAGNDSVDGGLGNDSIKGGDGNDTLLGGDGNDQLWGDAGNNRLDGGAGNDTIYAGQGDTVDGGNDNDVIYAVNAATILGGAGNDTIYAYYTTTDLTGVSIDGGAGDDTLRGGEAYFELGSLKDPILFLRTRAGIVHNKSWIVSLPYENAAVC